MLASGSGVDGGATVLEDVVRTLDAGGLSFRSTALCHDFRRRVGRCRFDGDFTLVRTLESIEHLSAGGLPVLSQGI